MVMYKQIAGLNAVDFKKKKKRTYKVLQVTERL